MGKRKQLNYDDIYAEKEIDKKYWPLLNEYFIRNQNMLGLSDEEIAKKADSVLQNINSIVEQGEATDAVGGSYSISEKKITVNINKIRRRGDKNYLANVIFHEAGHAGEHIGNSDSASFIVKLSGEKISGNNIYAGIALNEIRREMIASRLLGDRKHQLDSSKHVLQLDGYSDMIFLGSMLHSAFGMSETEFLKISENGRGAFENEAKKILDDPTLYEWFINKVDFTADTLHAIRYKSEDKKVYTEEENKNMSDAIRNVRFMGLMVMERAITHQAVLNKDNLDAGEYAKRWRYYLEKFEANYKAGLSGVKPELVKTEERDLWLEQVQSKILALEAIGKSRGSLSEEDYSKLVESLDLPSTFRKDELEEIYEKCGMKLDMDVSEAFFKGADPKGYASFYEENYSDDNIGNNRKMRRCAAKVIRGNFIKELYEELKESISAIQTPKNTKRLPPSPEPALLESGIDETISKESNIQGKLQDMTESETKDILEASSEKTLDKNKEMSEEDFDR